MKYSLAAAVYYLCLFLIPQVSCTTHSFAGSSLYFLHGLSTSDQEHYINTLANYGAKTIRLWINGLGPGCVKGSKVVRTIDEFETTIGKYNYDTLKALDSVLAMMAAKGMKAIISPHDGNDIHDGSVDGNGCDIYCKTYGTSFYTNPTAQKQYDNRIKAILSYKSPSSGLTWGNWSDAILAFDLENEPFQFTDDGANGDPSNWLCGRAENFKKYITDSNIKVATGGVGGDQSHTYNMLPAALKCSSIDLMSVHGYIGDASSWEPIMTQFESSCKANNKLLYVEEWGVLTSYPSNFNSQVAVLNKMGYPWVYWQMIPGDDGTQSCSSGCCTGYDGFEIGFSSKKGNLKAAVASINKATAVDGWSFVRSNDSTSASPTGGLRATGSAPRPASVTGSHIAHGAVSEQFEMAKSQGSVLSGNFFCGWIILVLGVFFM